MEVASLYLWVRYPLLLSLITTSHDVVASLVHLLGGDLPWYIMLPAIPVFLHCLSRLVNGSMGGAIQTVFFEDKIVHGTPGGGGGVP